MYITVQERYLDVLNFLENVLFSVKVCFNIGSLFILAV